MVGEAFWEDVGGSGGGESGGGGVRGVRALSIYTVTAREAHLCGERGSPAAGKGIVCLAAQVYGSPRVYVPDGTDARDDGKLGKCLMAFGG